MELTKQYAKLQGSLRNVTKDIANRILETLESPGSEILREEYLESAGYGVKLDSILILSKRIKNAIRTFQENIKRIGVSQETTNGSLFYITDFGGSKTQFLELIRSIIHNQFKQDEPPYSQIIPVVFNGTTDLNAQYLGEQIESSTAKILTRQIELLQRDVSIKTDPHAFENFMNLLLEFRKAKNAPEHLEKIYNLLNEIDRITDSKPGIRLKISNIRQELSQLPLIDEERLLKIVLDIMELASAYKIIYLFLFDECDDWLASIEEESKWNENIIKRQYFFRKLYDRIPHLRLYQIYCLTPRVHEVLRSEKSDSMAGIQRISASLIKSGISEANVQIREFGVYQGDEAIEATLKWLILLEKVYQNADKEIFKNFLPKLIDKVDNKLDRRKANSTIISSIRAFIKLTEDIKNGQNNYNFAERTSSHYITLGNIIEKTFSSYLNFLNFNYLKKHHDVGNGKLINGRFMISMKGNEPEFFAEIKTLKDPSTFNIEKARQVINCVKDPNSRAIFFLFCRGLTEDFVYNKFHEWKNYGHIPQEVNLDNIIIVVIQDQTLLNCLVGFEKILPSQLEHKLESFDKLLRLMNRDFHGKLINLFPQKGKIIEEEIEEIVEKETEIFVAPEQSYSELLQKLRGVNDTTIRTALEVVLNLGTRKKVYNFRKTQTVRTQLNTPLFRNSFDDAINFLKQSNIIHEEKNYLKFNWDVFDQADVKNDQEDLMIEVLKSLLNHIRAG